MDFNYLLIEPFEEISIAKIPLTYKGIISIIHLFISSHKQFKLCLALFMQRHQLHDFELLCRNPTEIENKCVIKKKKTVYSTN